MKKLLIIDIFLNGLNWGNGGYSSYIIHDNDGLKKLTELYNGIGEEGNKLDDDFYEDWEYDVENDMIESNIYEEHWQYNSLRKNYIRLYNLYFKDDQNLKNGKGIIELEKEEIKKLKNSAFRKKYHECNNDNILEKIKISLNGDLKQDHKNIIESLDQEIKQLKLGSERCYEEAFDLIDSGRKKKEKSMKIEGEKLLLERQEIERLKKEIVKPKKKVKEIGR